MIDYRRRRGTLFEQAGADGFVVLNSEGSDAASLYYLTGFSGEGALLIRDGREELVTDSRYTEQAEREAPDLLLHEAKGGYVEALAEVLRGTPTRRVAFSSRRMTYYTAEKARSLFDASVIADAEHVLEATRYQYEHGGASLVAVLVAQRTVNDVYGAYNAALAAHAHALVEVETSAGIWDVDFDDSVGAPPP